MGKGVHVIEIHSSDPIKKLVVTAIKRKASSSKVTLVRKLSNGSYQGRAYMRQPNSRSFYSVGFVTLTQGELLFYNNENKIPNQGITELFNQLGLISTEVSQNIERWTTRGAK
jgi:hypothetical protein